MKKKPEAEQVDFLHDLVEHNVRALVEHEDQVDVARHATSVRVVFTITVAPSDVGLVLGEGGATIDALRRIAWTACKKTALRCEVDVNTPSRR